jgi:16S rRNA (cytidine1402-2'-O)-methyltransferase
MQQIFGKLYIVATPIGNLSDISARALQTLRDVAVIACEDKRTSSHLCSYYNIKTQLVAYHDHNEGVVLPKLLERLQNGDDIALISDAGTPLISDPGYHLVEEAIAIGVQVIPIAGACSIITALSASGLPTDRFYFSGFLPNKQQMRRQKWQELAAIDATIVTFESVHRLSESLQDAAEIIPTRHAVVGREITKLYEEFRRGTLTELAAYYAAQNQIKGEVVLMLAPPPAPPQPNNEHINALIAALLPNHSTKQISQLLSEVLPHSKGTIYEMALRLKNNSNQV